MRLIKSVLAGALALSVFSPMAMAQYPEKPIRMVVGYAPGGAADKLIRPITDQLSKMLKQPFIIEYKPGAGASVAADFTAKSAPDGYTLHITDSGPMAILPNMKKMGYDPVKDFTPISMIGEGGVVVAVLPSSPAKDIKTLVELAKKDPQKWSYGTSGVGGVGHLAGEQFKAAAKLDIAHIPYKGGNPAITELLGGHVPFLFPRWAQLPLKFSQARLSRWLIRPASAAPCSPTSPPWRSQASPDLMRRSGSALWARPNCITDCP